MSPTFDTWVDKLAARARVYTLAREHPPTAFCRFPDGREDKIRLDGFGGGGPDYARELRAIAVVAEPTHIALVTEAWTLRPDIPATDPNYRRLAFGELMPSQLPEDQRAEVLTLYAEEAATGERVVRAWYIESEDNQRVRLVEAPLPNTDTVAIRFWPAFVVDEELRAVARGDPSIPREALEKVRKAAANMTEAEQRFHMRRAWAKMLLAGAGETSSQFRASQDELSKKARQSIWESGEPARGGG